MAVFVLSIEICANTKMGQKLVDWSLIFLSHFVLQQNETIEKKTLMKKQWKEREREKDFISVYFHFWFDIIIRCQIRPTD